MSWYQRGIGLGAGAQIGRWKQKFSSTVLGVYMLSTIPYILFGPWYALTLVVGVGYLVSLGLRLLLLRTWR